MSYRLLLKDVAIITAVTFMYSNFVWAEGLSCADKLAAQPQAAGVGRTLAEHPEGARLLAGEAVVKALGIDSISDIVKNMEALTESGTKCFVSRDAEGNTATYIIEDGAILRKTQADKKVNDKFYALLQLLGIEGTSETVEGETREYIYVTERNEGFINSVLQKLNPTWTVKPADRKTGQPDNKPTDKPDNRQIGKPTNEAGFSTVGALVMTTVLIGVGLVIYTFRNGIATWILSRSIGGYVFYGLIGAGLLVGLYFLTWRYVFPVSWYIWKLKSEDRDVRAESAKALGRIGDKSAIPALETALREDKSFSFRVPYASAEALGRIGDKSAIPALEVALKSYSYRYVRGVCTEALLSILDKNPGLEGEYIRKYGANYRDVLNAYILVSKRKWDDVVKLGVNAIPALETALKSDEERDVRRACAEALLSILDKNPGLEGEYISKYGVNYRDVLNAYILVSKRKWDDVVKLGVNAIPALETGLKSDWWHVRGACAEALLSILDKSPGLEGEYIRKYGVNYRDVLNAYILVSKRKWDDVVKLGVNAIPVLETVLKSDKEKYEYVRGACAEALGKIGDKSAIPTLEAVLKSDSDKDVRRACAEALGKMGDIRGVEYLIKDLIANDENEMGSSVNFLKGLGYRFQDEPAGLINPVIVGISVFTSEEVHGYDGIFDFVGPHTEYKKSGTEKKYMGKAEEELKNKQSHLTTVLEGKEEHIIQMAINNKGTIEEPQVTGDLAKLAGILGVDAEQVPGIVQTKLQGILKLIAKKYPGMLGAARQIILVDNLGGIDSNVRDEKGALASFQNGVIAIDIDAFRNDKVLKDVVLHELWHSILELVEGNKGIEEAAAVYQSLVYFTELSAKEQAGLITFLKQKDNGLQSEGYADLLQMVQGKGIKGEALISVAISYVLGESRYSGIKEGLMEGMSEEVKKTIEKLNLAAEIYQEIMSAVQGVPAVAKVKNAVTKSKILMKIKMIASRWSVDTGFIDKLKGQGKYIQLDVKGLEENPHMIDWLKRLTAEQQGTFIFSSSSETSAAGFMKRHGINGIDVKDIQEKGITRGNIITLLELGALDTSQDMPENSGLYLPYIYSVTGIYLAEQVILANGDFNSIEDNLVKTTLISTLGLDDPADLNALFRGQWPKAFRVSEIISELLNAIRQIEIAA